MSTNIVELTLENFQNVVLEQSKEKLILVDFWAEQVPESVQLKSAFEHAVQGAGEYIVLATVDCNVHQQIAMQFGVQGLPTAVLVKDGQPLDMLAGPQTQEQVNEFLTKHLPKEQDLLLKAAQEALSAGNLQEANVAINKAHELDADRADIKFVLVDVLLQLSSNERAKAILETIKMVDQDSVYQALVAKTELALQAADSPEIQQLEQALAEDPNNKALISQLASQYTQVGRNEHALDLLFKVVRSDLSDTDNKQQLLDVLKALPEGDPLVSKYRKKLYTLMY